MLLDDDEKKRQRLPEGVRKMNIRSSRASLKEESDGPRTPGHGGQSHRPSAHDSNPRAYTPMSTTHSPVKAESSMDSPAVKSEEETVGGDVSLVQEPGQPPKLSRTASRKIHTRPPQLFGHVPDATEEAQNGYNVIDACIYANKYLGTTDHAMECDCSEEWDPETKKNHACGEDSDCINRATKMECISDCNCGRKCQNQRFQRKQYANVSVIKTEKKGYGLRANVDLPAHAFIFEYIGEVIGEQAFRRRMVDYDQEGIKHFYFMSLNKGEFVDATKKGNKGRFCNHSCNPNCYVDKWVVGDRLRMGIFTDRKILAGEELVFNYNVDRYGADPQPCYCGEPNCTGYIGGKTQTERATKLSVATIEALGIEDGDDWDTAVAKKARKKKTGEDDEEYVDRLQPKSLDEGGVVKVMATLMQCKEKWIAVKLLSRIQQCDDERVRARVVKMHGYQILKSQLTLWFDDDNICLQILSILHSLPRITRNKIQDSGIETVVEKLLTKSDELVKDQAESIREIWGKLEMGFRIPRHNRLPGAEPPERRRRSRSRQRSRSRSRSKSPPNAPKGPAASSGQRGGFGGPRGGFGTPRGTGFGRGLGFGAPRGPQGFGQARGGFFGGRGRGGSGNPNFVAQPPPPLPAGWFSAEANGKTYFYSLTGETTWSRPTVPAAQPPPPPKGSSKEQELQDIINSITSEPQEKEKPATPVIVKPAERSPSSNRPETEKPKEKWMKYPLEKQKKLYENTLFPHVKHVMDKYTRKLPRDDLKRFAKECAKKIVNSDFKNKRVTNPMQLTEKQERGVKKYVKDFFDRAVEKKEEREARRAAEKAKVEANGLVPAPQKEESDTHMEEDVQLSDNEMDDDVPSPSTQDGDQSAELKRKREAEQTPPTTESPDEQNGVSVKRARSEVNINHPFPPPPPPPSGAPLDEPILPGGFGDVDEVDYGDGEEHGYANMTHGVNGFEHRTNERRPLDIGQHS